jgi:hypothetical protein
MYLCTGVIAYLGFGGYLGLGETLWNQPLNYYLLPVIVRLRYVKHLLFIFIPTITFPEPRTPNVY